MSDIYTNRDDLLKVNKQVTEQIIAEQIVPQFIEMIKESEKRIDNINKMITNLTDGAKEFANAANKMATSSANCQQMISELIKANNELSKTNGQMTNFFDKEITELRLELKEVNASYRKMCDHISSSSKDSSSTSTVKINL